MNLPKDSTLKVRADKIEEIELRISEKGWSQQTLARKAKISVDTVKRFLKEKKIRRYYFMQVAKTLGMEPADIVDCDRLNLKQTSYVFTVPDFRDFFGRQTELEQLERAIQAFPVILTWGNPGVGKTYLTARIAEELAENYKLCWLDGEGLTSEKLLLQINEFLKANNEQGFVTTFDEEKLANKNKIPQLVEVVSSSKYALLIDNFCHDHDFLDEKDKVFFMALINRFITHGKTSKLILNSRKNGDWLGSSLSTKIYQLNLRGFIKVEVMGYISSRQQKKELKFSQIDVNEIVKKTEGHPIAINLIIQRCEQGITLNKVINELIEYDKQSGYELHRKLLADIEDSLNPEEKKALRNIAILNTQKPIKRSVWKYLGISTTIGELLLQHGFITPVSYDKFQIHPLIQEFWEKALSPEEMLYLNDKVGHYYWDDGTQSPIGKLNSESYLKAYHHFRRSNNNEVAAQVINELICRLHKQEPLPSKTVTELEEWILECPDSLLVSNKQWLLLQKGKALEKRGFLEKAESTFRLCCQGFEQHNGNLEADLGATVSLYYVAKLILQKEPTLALKLLKQVLKKADTLMKIRTLGKIVSCYTDIGQYDEAESAANHAEELAKIANDKLGLALIFYRKGSIKRGASKFDEAAIFFSKSAKIYEELRDLYRHAKSLVRLGIVQGYQGQFQEAEANIKYAIQLHETIEDMMV